MDRCGLDRGMACEKGADEMPVPGPSILGVARRMNADKTAARADISLKGGLLRVIEDVAGRAQKHDDLVSRELRVDKTRRILGAVDEETVLRAQGSDGRDALWDRVVTKPGG